MQWTGIRTISDGSREPDSVITFFILKEKAKGMGSAGKTAESLLILYKNDLSKKKALGWCTGWRSPGRFEFSGKAGLQYIGPGYMENMRSTRAVCNRKSRFYVNILKNTVMDAKRMYNCVTLNCNKLVKVWP